MKLFHANLSSAKRLAASHSNPMSNSFIFIMEIHIVRCLPLGFFVCLREYWSAILAGMSSERRRRWPSQLSLLPETKESVLWCHRQFHWWQYSAIWNWEPQFSVTFARTSLWCFLVFSSVPRSRNYTKIHCSHSS